MSRKSSFAAFLKPPVFKDRETARRVEFIQTVMLPLFAAALVFVLAALFIFPDGGSSALVAVTAAGLLGLGLLAARMGFTTVAGGLIIFLLWLTATLNLYLGGGVSAPGHSVYLVAILMSAFILGLRATVSVMVISLVTTGVIAGMEAGGTLPESIITRDPMTYWWAQGVTILAASGLIWIALRQIHRSIDDARNNETLHRLVADSVDDFIWSLSSDMSFTYASPAVERILGYTPEEMLHRKALPRDLVPGSPVVPELVAQALAEGRDVLRYEAQQYRKDGTPVWCEFSIRLVLDQAGNFERVTGVTRDISERKAVEAKHLELEEQLRQSQKMEAIGQLAGGIAHDFNNYLTVILGNAEMLAIDTKAEKGSPLLEIEDAAIRSAELTQQLLAFSRKQVLQPVVLDLNASLRDADRLLRRVLGEDILIETICSPDLGHVEVDPNQLEQIILNLAVNARAAMPNGGRLTIETGNVYLDSEYAQRRIDVAEGQYVMLAVSDSGSGMDEQTRLRIFEPFFTTKASGSGLGLSTVHGIVKQSGGTIGVYSQPGEGTVFRIYFPRVEEDVDSREDRIELAGLDRGSESVLVVEDQEMVRRLIRTMLEARGYRVLIAGDRDEAVAVAEAEQGRIDLLLTDIILPGPNGVELAHELTDRFGIPVLYMSGFTENGTVHSGILYPEHLLLQKPFTIDQLTSKVRKALQR